MFKKSEAREGEVREEEAREVAQGRERHVVWGEGVKEAGQEKV